MGCAGARGKGRATTCAGPDLHFSPESARESGRAADDLHARTGYRFLRLQAGEN
jgi:hypothetical protein